jgi:bacteriocin-type transport-associated protein
MLRKIKSILNHLTLAKKLTLLFLIIFLGGMSFSGIALSTILDDKAQNEISLKALFVLVMGIVLIIFAFTLFMTNLWLKQSIVRPIKQIIRVAEGVSMGHIEAVFEKVSNDEVGNLAEALMRMKQSLVIAIKQCEPKLMTEVLIQQLRNSDINWMIANGHQQAIASGAVLIEQQSNVDNLYIVLDGTLSASLSGNQDKALVSTLTPVEVCRFFQGEVFGEMSFLHSSPSATTVRAVENSIVLALPCQELLAKLQQELGFASRFYRAIAILLLDRFERLVKEFIGRQNLQIPPLQNVSLIFGELNDSDVDWMIEHSHVENIAMNTILIQADRPVETLYVLLQGSVSVSFSEQKGSALDRIFTRLENKDESQESPGTEIARMTRGEIVGEMALLDARLPRYTFKALEDLQVLAISKQQLFVKLQQNPSMGTRFYRVVAMLLSARLQGLINRLVHGRNAYQLGQMLSQNFEYDGEIDSDVMDNISLGGARFNWMLKRLKVQP